MNSRKLRSRSHLLSKSSRSRKSRTRSKSSGSKRKVVHEDGPKGKSKNRRKKKSKSRRKNRNNISEDVLKSEKELENLAAEIYEKKNEHSLASEAEPNVKEALNFIAKTKGKFLYLRRQIFIVSFLYIQYCRRRIFC